MKSFIFLVCFTAFSISLQAQQPLHSVGKEDTESDFTIPMTNTWLNRFEKRQTKMIQLLGLNDGQKRSLDTLNDRYVTQKAVLHEDKSLTMRARLSKNEVMRRERDAKFRNILSPQQLAKWNELRKAQQKKAFRKK